MKPSVLVTGACGQVGRRTVMHLLDAGHEVVAMDLRSPKTERIAATFAGRARIVWGDIGDAEHWPEWLAGVGTVVHVAAMLPPATDRHPDRAVAVNRTATLTLIRCMEASTTAKRLIFASSAGVAGCEQYRRTPPLTVAEEPRATDLYGRTKIDAERGIQASALRWSILRLGVVVAGESAVSDAANLDAMWEASSSGRVEVVHDDDAGLAFARAVDCDAAIGRIIYIGGGERCRTLVQDFYDRFLGAVGLGPLDPRALRRGSPYFYGDWLDTSESQGLLGYQRHSLDDILDSRRKSFGAKRWLIRPMARLINHMIEKRSPHLRRA